MSKELTTIKKDEPNVKREGFDYGKVDSETGKCMKQAVEKIILLREKTRKTLGEQFSIVQDKLAGNNQYNGFFEKWYESLGFKKDFVYDSINYYKLLIANPDNQMIQKLSISKICEVAKLKEKEELQKEVIERAPLDKMKTKQVTELVKEVKEKQEVTDALIQAICANGNEDNCNVEKFISATNTLIKELKDQAMPKEKLEKVLKVINEVQDLCTIEENNKEVEKEATNGRTEEQNN